jgi:RNA polymerase sigma-70 factor (ECF subfamily)
VASRQVTTFIGTLEQPAPRETKLRSEETLESSGAEVPAAPRSLAELYDSYADFVYGSLVGLGVAPERAEDAMQDVFVIANRHLATFEGTFHRAWLFRIAHSVARNARRAIRRTVGEPLESLQLVDGGSSPFERAAHAEQVRLLSHLLDQLKDQQREVFVLAELEQLAHVEIAAALGIHVNTVANRLTAARANLERLLRKQQREVDPSRRKT